MKCQAFVEFASPALAEQALDATHGVVVNGKPLIVVRPQASLSTRASAVTMLTA